MAHAGEVIEVTPDERLVPVTTSADSDGEPLAMDAHYGPAGHPPPEHYHPHQEERFTGTSGTVTARVAGAEQRSGRAVRSQFPRVKHAFWNPGGEAAVLRREVRPALRTEQMFEDLPAAGATLRKAFVLPGYRRNSA